MLRKRLYVRRKRVARHVGIEGARADFFNDYISYYISELFSAFHSYYTHTAQYGHTTCREIKRGLRFVTYFSNLSVQGDEHLC